MIALSLRPSATRFFTHLLRALVDARKAADRWLVRRPAPAAAHKADWEQSLPCLFHEMLNYSATLRNNALLLRNQSVSAAILEPLGRMVRTTEKMESLAREVLDLASVTRLTAVASLDARRLVETCISEHFPERAGAFEVRADMDGLRIRGDGRKLERVFLNLFRNAFEAGAARIRIHLTALGNRPLILVEDDGKGCPEAELGMLFQRNFTTKSGSGGSGIGLHLAEATLEAHGGAIRAVSKNGWPADAEAMARRRPDCDARPAPMASEGHWDTGMIFCLEFPVASI